ncbi:MAG: hypothetical protein GC200_00465 [Tepidisphaera sp.]|nr:hypothetical protein [Tepidisphaera sp.]
MARSRDDIDDVEDLDEDPSPEDLERFGGVTVKCPKCGSELYDDAAMCWKCGHALSASDAARPPIWLIIVAVLALLGLLYLTIR